MNLQEARESFPATKDFIYLENAAFTPTPLPVAKAVYEYMEEAGRGFTTRFVGRTLDMVAEARENLARFLGARPEEIAIVRNTAEGACHVANGLKWEEGDKILMSDVEHPSNWLPWARLKDRGVMIVVVPTGDDGRVSPEDFQNLIDKKTKLITLNQIPSPTGIIQPCEEIGKIAKDLGVLYYVDAAQSAGQIKVDVDRLHCDFLAFTGAKFMCAPQGTGVFYVRGKHLGRLPPTTIGWSTIDSERSAITLGREAGFRYKDTAEVYEAPGTPPWPLIAGLGRAVKFLQEAGGVEYIEERLRGFARLVIDRLKDIPRAKIHGTLDPRHRGGTIGLNIEGMDPVYFSALLYRIDFIITAPKPWGFVRESPHFYNSEEEMVRFIRATELVATKDLKFFARSVLHS